jgi:flagellar basal body-associated protein FliL
VNAGFKRLFQALSVVLACLMGNVLSSAPAAATIRMSDVTVSAEPDSLFTGERLHYIITVLHEGRETVSIASLRTGQGTPFEITGTKSTSRNLNDGRAEFRMDTELAVFGSGQQALPGFTVQAGNGTDGVRERLVVTPSASVTVLSMSDSTVTELHPIAPPVSAPFPTWLLIPVMLVLLVLAMSGYLVWRFVSALRRHLDDPVRAARTKLRTIRRQLSKGLLPAAGYESLSNILREFLQNRYQFGALEMVTQEIAEELAVRRINIREELIKLLDQADLVKFADSRPNIEECSRSLKIAETLIASATEPETPLMVDG